MDGQTDGQTDGGERAAAGERSATTTRRRKLCRCKQGAALGARSVMEGVIGRETGDGASRGAWASRSSRLHFYCSSSSSSAITRAVLSLARFIRARHENKTATLTSYNDRTRQERNAVLYSTCRVWPGITSAQRHMQVYALHEWNSHNNELHFISKQTSHKETACAEQCRLRNEPCVVQKIGGL